MSKYLKIEGEENYVKSDKYNFLLNENIIIVNTDKRQTYKLISPNRSV
jgi:hypothetical protein